MRGLGRWVLSACVGLAALAGCGDPEADLDEDSAEAGLRDRGFVFHDRGLSLRGHATISAFDPAGLQTMPGSLTLRNLTRQPVALDRAVVLFESEGGYSFSAGVDLIAAEGSFLGIGPALPAFPRAHIVFPTWAWNAPVLHIVYRVEGSTSSNQRVEAMAAIPVRRPGFVPPGPSIFDSGSEVVLAVQGPLESVPLTSGSRWLTIEGQVVDTTGTATALGALSAELRDRRGGALAAVDLIPDQPQHLVFQFFGAALVPDGTAAVALQVQVATATGPVALKRVEPIRPVQPLLVAAPTSGRWLYSNGPGVPFQTSHFVFPEQRYAYDLAILQIVNGQPSTFDGDPAVNDSYFAFRQPFHAALDGEVIEVVNDVPDNNGNVSVNPPRNNRIVLRHAHGLFTLYAHGRQGSAAVQVGQHVRAGDMLAEVGNAGFSTEPHLHFQAYRLDATGRVHALPTAFRGLTAIDGAPLTGAPVAAQEYVTP